MNQVLLQSILKFLLRRGLTLLGSAGAAVTDEWIAQTVSLLLIVGNEAYQWFKAHQADQKKADLVIVTDGCDSVSEQVAEKIAALRAQTGLRVFAMTINGGALDSNLAAVADEVLDLDATADVGETVAKAGWAR